MEEAPRSDLYLGLPGPRPDAGSRAPLPAEAGAHQAPAGPAQTPPFPLLPKALAKERSEESYVTCFIIRTWKNSCEASARPGVQSHSGIYLAVRGLCPRGSKPSAPSLERDQTPVLLSVSSLRGACFCHWAGLV